MGSLDTMRVISAWSGYMANALVTVVNALVKAREREQHVVWGWCC